MRIYVLGDSLAHGTGDSEGLGWVGRLPIIEDVQYFRLGVPGQTTSQILARAYHEVTARMVPYHDNLVIIGASINDLSLDEADNIRTNTEILKAQFEALIQSMMHLAPVLVVGPPPIDEEFNPYFVSALGEHRSWKNAIIGEASDQFAEICNALKVPYFDLFDALKNDPSYKGSLRDYDGLHPETMGYVGIADYISNWKAFRSKLPDAQPHSHDKNNDAKKESK